MSASFFQQINYSACNEDSEAERLALSLTNDDTVLCITGSGARAFDLLIDNPKEIISVDFNPTQNFLLALKIAAYQVFSYSEFIQFLGIKPCAHRVSLFEKLPLEHEVKQYWAQHLKVIEKGVIYAGTWEKLQKKMARFSITRKRKLTTLFSFTSVEAQYDYWQKHWDNSTWKGFLKVLSNRFLWTKVIREPGAALIPKDFNIYGYLYQRMDFMASHHLLRTNHFAHLMFFGAYQDLCELPLHLQEQYYKRIQQRVTRITPKTVALDKALEDTSVMQSVSAFSLSDFSSYCTPDQYRHIWTLLEQQALPNAKICERFFLIQQEPEKFVSRLQRNHELDEELAGLDKTAIYTFCSGVL